MIPPQIKIAGNYTSSMIAKWRARKNGYDEIIFTDEEGYITEAPTSNVFIINQENVLLTAPESDVLYGITRKSILEIARNENINIKEDKIPLYELENAREVFLTSSSHLISPVVKIDNRPLENQNLKSITNKLKMRFLKIIKGEDSFSSKWLDKI